MSNVEDHYAEIIKIVNDLGPKAKELGVEVAWAYLSDPRHLLFTLSRYKFVSKMFDGMKKVLEIGCGDGFASRLLLQNISSLVAIDIDKLKIDDANGRQSKTWPIDFRIHDILDEGPILEEFDGVVSLDVMEHIPRDKQQLFLDNIYLSLSDNGCAIIGMPSIESQEYASDRSKIGHVSCLDQKTFKTILKKKFQRVFIFSMNDEVVHTGFSSMSHYNLALCIKN